MPPPVRFPKSSDQIAAGRSTTKTNLNFIAFPPRLKDSLLPQAPVMVETLDQTFDTSKLNHVLNIDKAINQHIEVEVNEVDEDISQHNPTQGIKIGSDDFGVQGIHERIIDDTQKTTKENMEKICTNRPNKKIKRTLHDSSNIMVQNKNITRIKCQTEISIVEKLKRLKEVTITPVHNTINEEISVLQKKLPEITFIKDNIFSKQEITPKPKKVVCKKMNSTAKQKQKKMQNNTCIKNPKNLTVLSKEKRDEPIKGDYALLHVKICPSRKLEDLHRIVQTQ